uniref:CHK domain-containing protein n=1 Tax=Anopheles minimus TaxID=112268 RepID=A0A182VXY4_9DIPT
MSELSWQTGEYFKDVIACDLCLQSEDSFTITNFNIAKANEKTAGYMSLIHRVCIEVVFDKGHNKPTTLSYIVKEKSDSAFGGNLVEVLSVFPKECEMYEKLLPAFEDIFNPERFGPKVFKTTSEPYTVIVMEDLTLSGFYMREKSYGLPITDVKRILQKLAEFHAVSVVYRERNGSFSDLFSEGVITERTVEVLRGHYDALYTAFLQSLRERNFPAEYLRPLMALDGRLLEACSTVQRLDPSEFNVLNHGDLWPNNVLFGENDLRLLDFQNAFYGSFASDLLYFFVTSATQLMCDSLEELVQFYYENLVKAFEQLHYRQLIPSYADLLQQLKQHGILILPPLSEAVAITMGGLTEPSDMALITSEQPEGVTLRQHIFNNPSFVTLVDRLIPKLFELGLLHKSEDSVH